MTASTLTENGTRSNGRAQDDLYRHVNGRWLAEQTIPEDKPVTGVFERLQEASLEAGRQICQELAQDPALADQPATARLGQLWRDFMDEAKVESSGAAPLAQWLDQIERIADLEGLRSWLGWSAGAGLSSLLDLAVEVDPGRPSRQVLFVAQAGLGLPDESYYRQPEHAAVGQAYRVYLARALELAGIDQSEQRAEAVWELERQIAACHWDIVKTRDLVAMYNLRQRAELTQAAPGLGWETILTRAGIDQSVVELVDCQPSFFVEVAALLQPDRLEVWRDWARVRLVSDLAPYLSDDFVRARFDFYGRALLGTPQLKPRWKRALDLIEAALGEALGQIYVERHFPASAKAQVEELVDHLLAAYRASIGRLDWMSQTTKEQAWAKLDGFRAKLGYPARWRDYSGLELVPGDLVGNVIRAGLNESAHQLAKLSRPVDPDEWLMTPQTVNAYYHPLRNEIVFPAAILQPPFFDPEADPATNFGAIGAVIGHEIGHGFDDQGSTTDGQGRLRDWWTPQDRERFEARTGRLIDQYAALSPAQTPGRKVNGELTIGENIGDLGGLGIAWKAWRQASGDDDQVVDGLTGSQRLFISWAKCWATKARDEYVAQQLAVDPHSPAEFRCNQPARNLDAFHQAFDVRPGDGMWLDPADRVTIW
ncbi:MAG: peptidase M13 [Propionibacteriaceae bacterium]|nr:peptidase M13 [Propionibacteriaceae bacterium]